MLSDTPLPHLGLLGASKWKHQGGACAGRRQKPKGNRKGRTPSDDLMDSPGTHICTDSQTCCFPSPRSTRGPLGLFSGGGCPRWPRFHLPHSGLCTLRVADGTTGRPCQLVCVFSSRISCRLSRPLGVWAWLLQGRARGQWGQGSSARMAAPPDTAEPQEGWCRDSDLRPACAWHPTYPRIDRYRPLPRGPCIPRLPFSFVQMCGNVISET